MKKYSNIELTGSISLSGSFIAPPDVILQATSSYAETASLANQATSASFAATASLADTAVTSSYSLNVPGKDYIYGRINPAVTATANATVNLSAPFLNTTNNLTASSGVISGFTVGKSYELFFSGYLTDTVAASLTYRWFLNNTSAIGVTGTSITVNSTTNASNQPITYVAFTCTDPNDNFRVKITALQGNAPTLAAVNSMYYVREL
jgi:hypothetical protein